jgi:CMP-N-acetylneuraminic acid synthetase
MIIKAVVPIKMKSKRLPGKNIMKIKDKTLVEWSIETLNKVKKIDEIIVYCSDKKIEEYIVSRHRTILRPRSLDEDDKNIKHIMMSLLEKEHADIWIILHATSPFISSETISEMLEKVTKGMYHSSFAVVKHQKYVWYMGEPLNFNPKDIGFTQTTEPVYLETSGPFVFYEEGFKKTGKRVSNDPYIKVVSMFEGIDIDTKEDFELAKIIGENYDF